MKKVPVPLYQYQKLWLEDESRFKIGMFARQTGKTFIATLEIVLDCVSAEAAGERRRWVILSRGERQAKEAMNEGVRKHLDAVNIVLQHYNERYLDDLCVIAHEAVLPIVSAGHRLLITSTPNGKGNMFYTLMSSQESTFSKHTCDIYKAIQQGLPRDAAVLKKTIADDEAWRQEYELLWVDEATSWLPYDLIARVEHEKAGRAEHYAGGLCYVGEDIARRNDLWVLWVSELVGDVLWTREIIARRNISFAEQDALRDEVMRRYRVARLCMDQTGMGEKPVEDAKRQYGTSVVEGVLFTAATKQHLATIAKQRFEDRKVRIPMGDEGVRRDLHSLQKLTTATGGVRFDANRDEGGHADRAWACWVCVSVQ